MRLKAVLFLIVVVIPAISFAETWQRSKDWEYIINRPSDTYSASNDIPIVRTETQEVKVMNTDKLLEKLEELENRIRMLELIQRRDCWDFMRKHCENGCTELNNN